VSGAAVDAAGGRVLRVRADLEGRSGFGRPQRSRVLEDHDQEVKQRLSTNRYFHPVCTRRGAFSFSENVVAAAALAICVNLTQRRQSTALAVVFKFGIPPMIALGQVSISTNYTLHGISGFFPIY